MPKPPPQRAAARMPEEALGRDGWLSDGRMILQAVRVRGFGGGCVRVEDTGLHSHCSCAHLDTFWI